MVNSYDGRNLDEYEFTQIMTVILWSNTCKKAKKFRILFTSNSVVHGPMASFVHIIALSPRGIWK